MSAMTAQNQPYRVLVVDDHPYLRRAATRSLRSFDVVVAEDASEALALLAEQSFDLVVSDFHMPNKNGVQLLDDVRTRYPATRRLLTSADPPRRLRGLIASGVIERFIPKPWERSLAAEVGELLSAGVIANTDQLTGLARMEHVDATVAAA